MKKLTIYIFLILLVIPFLSNAQRWKRYRYEWSAGLGTVNVFGDFGGGSGIGRHSALDLDFQGTRPVVFGGFRYKLRELVALKTSLYLAYAKTSDNYTTNTSRVNRGGTSHTFFIEPSVQLEYSLIRERYSRYYTMSNISHFNFSHINTYLFLGFSGLIYFPSRDVEKETGQGKPQNIAVAFPMGMGFKYSINRVYSFGIEIGHRYTTTDYLDGHSDVWSRSNDSYLFLLFSISKRLRSTRRGLPKF